MKYELIDVKRHVEEDVEFGTCELCMSIGTLEYAVAVVKDNEGNVYEFENGSWSWGAWYPYSYEEISNIVDFAAWLREKEFDKELSDVAFWNLVDDYNESKGKI